MIFNKDLLIENYNNEDLKELLSNLDILTNTQEKIKSASRKLSEALRTHEYVRQIIMDSTKNISMENIQINDINNLIRELKFSKLSYEGGFESLSEEIDEIENRIIEEKSLLEKCLGLKNYSIKNKNKISTKFIQFLDKKNNEISKDIEQLETSLHDLLIQSEESLGLFNTVELFLIKANKIANNLNKEM